MGKNDPRETARSPTAPCPNCRPTPPRQLSTLHGAFYKSALYPLLERINAYLMRWTRKAGAAHVLLGDHPTPQDLARALDKLISDVRLRAGMAAEVARLGRPHAAHDLAAVLLNIAGRRAEHLEPRHS